MKRLSDSKNIKLGVVLTYISMIVSFLGTLLVTNKVLTYVGDYNYGLYSFVNSITSWLSIFSAALIASYLRFSSIEAKTTGGDISRINTYYFKMLLFLGLIILLSGSFVLLVLLISRVNFLDYSWEDSEMMYYIFFFSVFNIALTMPISIFPLYITYKKEFVFNKLVVIFTSIISFLGNFLIAYFTKNIVYISLYTIVITVITFLFNYFYSKRVLGISFVKVAISQDKQLVKRIILFSSILLLNSVVDQINSNMDKTLLGIYSTPENVTLYQVGHQFAVYLLVMSTAVSSVFSPTINSLVVDGNDDEVNRLFLKISHFQLIIVCLISFGFCASGDSFVRWWIGDSRIEAYYVGAILMLLNIAPLTFNSSIEIQRAKNKHLFRAITYVLAALLNVGLSIVFLNVFSKEHSVFACLLGTAVSITISHWILTNIYNAFVIKLPIKAYLFILMKYIIFGALSFSAVYFLNKYCLAKIISKDLLLFVIKGSIYVAIFTALVVSLDYKFISPYLKSFINRFRKK